MLGPLHALRAFSTKHFVAIVLLSVGVYLALEWFYFQNLPLVTDELDGAYDVYLLKTKLPYADFHPYKTVLGYYLELLPLLWARDVWSGLMSVKIMLALINGACMAGCAWLVARLYSRSAVVLALPLWVVMTNWVDRSSELRVDTLTALAGVFSLLALLRGRALLAGFLCGLSFLVSQKGIYYFAASMTALGIAVLWRRAAWREQVRFGAVYAATLAVYFAGWSSVTTLSKITKPTFLSHGKIAFSDIYPHIRQFWTQSLLRNPAFYALALLAILMLARRVLRAAKPDGVEREAPQLRNDLLLAVYSAVLLACAVWHKQPWPYFFVLLIPTCFVLHAALFEAGWNKAAELAAGWGVRHAVVGASLLVPLLGFGIYEPLAHYARTLDAFDNRYQRHMVKLASALLGKEEQYLAAFDVLYDRTQSSSLLRRVSREVRDELRQGQADDSAAIVAQLSDNPPKLLLRNKRFAAFPKAARQLLTDNYAQYCGSLDLYAPRLPAAATSFPLAYSGAYRVTTRYRGSMRINGKSVKHDQIVTLQRGTITLKAARSARLYLQAPRGPKTECDLRFQARRELVGTPYLR